MTKEKVQNEGKNITNINKIVWHTNFSSEQNTNNWKQK